MFNIEEFVTDLGGLKMVQSRADELQKVFEFAATEFTKKYQGAILKDDKENREYAIWHVTGWNHQFHADLNGLHKKKKNQITQQGKYINLDDLEKMIPMGENLEDRG